MAHLIRIFSKTTPVRSCELVVPHCIVRRYSTHKKLVGLKLPSMNENLFGSEHNRVSTYEFPSDKKKSDVECKNKFGRTVAFYEKISEYRLQTINTITGVSVTPYSIGWSKMDLNQKSLLDFGTVVLSPNGKNGGCQTREIYKAARAICHVLPAADIYICESGKHIGDRNKSADLFQIQLLSMLMALLNNDATMEKVFLQKSHVIDFLYELRVKNERVSAGQKLQRMLDESVHIGGNVSDDVVADLGCVKLNVTLDFLNMIFGSQPLRRDAVAVSFFLALSFIELNAVGTASRGNGTEWNC